MNTRTLLLPLILSLLIGQKAQVFAQTKTSKELTGTISLSGAFALYPLAIKWAEEFKKLHPKVKIDLSASGAGKGITDVLSGVIDLGMVSREIHTEELKKGAVAFAVAKDAVVPILNTKNPRIKEILAKGLSQTTATNIYISGKIKTWGQVLGTSSTIAIHAYTRSDACGAAETWAAFLGKKQEDLKGTAVYGDPGLAAAVQRDPLGLGFNNIAYAYDFKTKKPNPGLVVLPIDINKNGRIDADEKFYSTSSQLIEAIASGKYPTPPARDLYLVSKGKPSNPTVVAFLKFVLTQGQQHNVPSGYIGLSKTKLTAGLIKLN